MECQSSIETHESVKNNFKYSCKSCDIKFTRKGILKNHEKTFHKYPCDQCGYISNLKHNLKYHINAKHKGFRYKCNQCD